MQIVMTIVVLALVIGLYIGSYILNKNTPVPEGITPMEECNACNTTTCGHHPTNNVKDDIKEFIKDGKEYDCEI